MDRRTEDIQRSIKTSELDQHTIRKGISDKIEQLKSQLETQT